jgi:hypothetical protein
MVILFKIPNGSDAFLYMSFYLRFNKMKRI